MSKRYWIDDRPTEMPFGKDTCGIVDEKAKGIVAYIYNLKLAQKIRKLLEDSK